MCEAQKQKGTATMVFYFSLSGGHGKGPGSQAGVTRALDPPKNVFNAVHSPETLMGV